MKVGIYTQSLADENKGRGIGFYTKYLIDYLKKRSDLSIETFHDITKVKADLVHYPTFDFYRRSLKIDTTPTVVTIHDVTPLVFTKHYPPGIKGKINLLFQKKQLKKVAAILTDSESSKVDIHKYLGISLDKIYVTYLSFHPRFKKITDKRRLEEIRIKYQLPENFVLFTGNVNWNKNLVNLTQASIDVGVDLVLIGSSFDKKDNLNHPEMKSYKEFLERFLDNPKVHIKGFIPDEDIVEIYNLADVLLFPSFYEGFGLPVLEAQACGIPVITSKIASLPEVAGEGALFVDPYKVEDIILGLKKLADKKVREELIKKGAINIKRFSWQKTAEETVNVYKKVI